MRWIDHEVIRLKIWMRLSELRDKKWMPSFLVKFIDWIRYEFFYES